MSELEETEDEEIILWKEDQHWIIKHTESGVTTQGESRIHALLMLADALKGYGGSAEDIGVNEDRELMDLAEDVFTLSDEQKQFIENLEKETTD